MNGAKRLGVRQSFRLRGTPKRHSGATAAGALGTGGAHFRRDIAAKALR
jgi:hypothetical protein